MAIEDELALRLAWYVVKYGPIPQSEQMRLFRTATGFAASDADRELSGMAREILEYFRQGTASTSD